MLGLSVTLVARLGWSDDLGEWPLPVAADYLYCQADHVAGLAEHDALRLFLERRQLLADHAERLAVKAAANWSAAAFVAVDAARRALIAFADESPEAQLLAGVDGRRELAAAWLRSAILWSDLDEYDAWPTALQDLVAGAVRSDARWPGWLARYHQRILFGAPVEVPS